MLRGMSRPALSGQPAHGSAGQVCGGPLVPAGPGGASSGGGKKFWSDGGNDEEDESGKELPDGPPKGPGEFAGFAGFDGKFCGGTFGWG